MTLELPDPLKRLLQASIDRGLAATSTCDGHKRCAAALPRLDGHLPLRADQLSKAGLFALLED
jgi:hypothetical protein